MEDLTRRLEGLGFNAPSVSRVLELAASEAEALRYLRADRKVTELWSRKYNRPYYQPEGASTTTWDPPPSMLFAECCLDADSYGVSVAQAAAIFSACHRLVAENDALGPDRKTAALETLGRMLHNILACGNAEPKFRSVKKTNARFAKDVLALRGGGDVLRSCGFCANTETYYLEETADLAPLRCCHARLMRLLDRKGHLGTARLVDDDKPADRRREGLPPGFEYQEQIFWCSRCSKPINDGTTRLRTRSHETPKGEFRYACSTCPDYHLCEICFDKLGKGEFQHAHAFTSVPPRESLHGAFGQQPTESNPWGLQLNGASAARARERLRDRTGL
jgi:hypothetical protein